MTAEYDPKSDIFELYFKYRADTEPPIIFHRWALLSVLGAWLGRSCWLPFGSDRIFPNQYVMFVGDPGSRKSSAIKQAVGLLGNVGYTNLAPKKSSKEQFLADLTSAGQTTGDSVDDFDVLATHSGTPVESYIAADEFNIFMGAGNIDFQSLLGDLWDWDSEAPWEYRLKNSKSVSIYQPTINILGGNTPTGFAECFPPASVGQGFMSRLILIHGERTSKRIPFPTEPDPKLRAKILELMVKIKTACVGPFQRTTRATEALSTIYTTWPGISDPRFTHYSERRFTHLLKLAMLHAACRQSLQIDLIDVIRASTILAYAETQMPKAVGDLGKARSSEATHKIMQALYNAKKPLSTKVLWTVVQTDLEKPSDLSQILNNLLLGEKIQYLKLVSGEGYLPKQKGVERTILFYDPKWLKGRELP